MQWQVAFDRTQVEEMALLLETYADRAKDLHPAFDRIVDDFHSMERTLFATAGASEGLDWPEIRPDTHRRHPEHQAPMVMTGALRASLTRRGSKYSITTIRDDSVTVGTRDPVANLHQHKSAHGGHTGLSTEARRFGGSAYTNVERRVMFVSYERGDHWLDIVTDHLLGGEGDGLSFTEGL